MVFIPMLQKHIYWGAMWECLVDRSERVVIGRRASTDQWIQKESSVKLLSIWVCARSSGGMQEGCSVKGTGLRDRDPTKHVFLEDIEPSRNSDTRSAKHMIVREDNAEERMGKDNMHEQKSVEEDTDEKYVEKGNMEEHMEKDNVHRARPEACGREQRA